MVSKIRPVLGCGPDGCTQALVRGKGEFGLIVEVLDIGVGEVWEVRWPDGSTDLWFQSSDA